MGEKKFLRCRQCGNMVEMLNDSGVPVICCNEPMEELIPNTVEAAAEKHIPVINRKQQLVHVTVGSVPHPMTREHQIEFIYLQTKTGSQMKYLCAGDEAGASFMVLEDEPVIVYAYCNLHGLWKAELSLENEAEKTCCSAEFPEGCI